VASAVFDTSKRLMDVERTASLDAALRAALVPAFTPRRWRRFIDGGGDPTALDSGNPLALERRLGISRREAGDLARQLRLADPAAETTAAAAAGVEIDDWEAEGYPPPFRQLADPPPVVYRRGTLLECDERAVAVVGSRRPTAYGLRVARALATDLARAGVTIVSGLARGIDAAAHRGALAAGGRTVAVLGSGLLDPYPGEHLDLLEEVVASGAVLSEFPLRAPPSRTSFPRRNRLIAALGAAVVVVEAASRSGALSTARHALDLGRSVLAVPGPVDQETSRGTFGLLQEGAAPVGGAADVFAALGWCATARSRLPPDERRVLEALPEDGASPTELAAALELREEAVAGLLVTLEVRGLAVREGCRYVPQ